MLMMVRGGGGGQKYVEKIKVHVRGDIVILKTEEDVLSVFSDLLFFCKCKEENNCLLDFCCNFRKMAKSPTIL